MWKDEMMIYFTAQNLCESWILITLPIEWAAKEAIKVEVAMMKRERNFYQIAIL